MFSEGLYILPFWGRKIVKEFDLEAFGKESFLCLRYLKRCLTHGH